MSLTPGTRLGPYEVLGPLGAGGMGEVWRARDPRLGRDVAIKALPAAFAQDPDRLARFEREAKLLASLSHPNVAGIHGLEEVGGARYLVLEFVEGGTLADRIARGALPLDETLEIARQIAAGVEAAHERGVIHRDLKPGNVMLKPDGVVKVLDFGLAKSGAAAASGSDPNLSASPTMTYAATQQGVILGTAAYMSPEQARGRNVDTRTDVWSFGCVLFECLTGRKAFDGETVSDLVARILEREPDWSALPDATPARLRELISRCLTKDARQRLQAIGEARIALERADDAPALAAATPARGRSAAMARGIAGVALAIAVAAWFLAPGRGSGIAPARARLMVPEPPNARLSGLVQSFAISPDGRTLVFVAADSTGTGRLWLRPLDGLSAKPLAGTDNADLPFWSPDSRSIGFFADAKLKRIGVEGGKPEVLSDAPDARGGTWGRQGEIVFAPTATGALFSVPADGGDVTEVVRPDSARGETALRFPEFLPDGRQFLFISLPLREGGYEVHLGRIGSHERKPVMRAGAAPVYAEPGWLVTLSKERLIAQRFDAGAGKLVGKPVTLGDAPLATGHDGTRAVSVSRTGVLVHSAGRRSNTQLGWLDRAGRVEQMLALPAGVWEDVSISPDDRRALVARRVTATDRELWLVDLASGQAGRFTFAPSPQLSGAVWSPDGRRVVYARSTKGPADLYLQPVEGGEPELLFGSPTLFKNPYQWSPDGRYLTFEQPDRETGWDVWMVPVDGDRTPVPAVRTPSNEGGGWFSPDGRWLVYYSDESGGYELYVRSFPAPGARYTLGGTRVGASAFIRGCWWSRDGREIVFQGADGLVRSVGVIPGATWSAGRARDLFRASEDVVAIHPTSDMRRFLATIQVEETPPAAIVVDLNWTTALRKP